jgi:hypothetical protein
MKRKRRNKRKNSARGTGNGKAVRGQTVKVKHRSDKACTTINQKSIE